jgi:hypothetical protein
MADSMAFLIYQTMKNLIKEIKLMYQVDPEGLFGSIAVCIFGYILFWHVLPIIEGI